MLLGIFLTGIVLWNLPAKKHVYVFSAASVEPGYLDFDNLPETNFSCEEKVIGGYYADVETGCQMFHVCTIGQKSETTDIKFLCLNGTVFDQETRVCERLDEVDCSKSESFFDLNLKLYGNNDGFGVGIQPEGETVENPEKCDEYEDGSCKPKEETETKPSEEEFHEFDYTDFEESTSVKSVPVTSPRPSTTSKPTSPKPTPAFHYRPLHVTSTTPDNTVAQLLALHEAFQQSLKQEGELKHSPPVPIQSSYKNPHSQNGPAKLPLPTTSNPKQRISNTPVGVQRNKSTTFTQTVVKPDDKPTYYKIQPSPPDRYSVSNIQQNFQSYPPTGQVRLHTLPQDPVLRKPSSGFVFDIIDHDYRDKNYRKPDITSHSNFARAADDVKPKSNSSKVVTITRSSVSSSVSLKPKSAIVENAKNSSLDTRKLTPVVNITDINESLSTTDPYYDEEYEYEDEYYLHHTDLPKIKEPLVSQTE